MSALAPGALLDIWVRGQSLHPVDRALLLLGSAFPADTPDAVAALNLGARDRRLIAIREGMFGSIWNALAECEQCGEQLEFSLETGDLPHDSPDVPGPVRVIDLGDRQVEVRPVNSFDLAAIAGMPDHIEARRLLAERCSPNAVGAAPLSDSTIDAISQVLGELDPDAEILIDLVCPDCGHEWQTVLDVPDFIWREVAAEARRLMHEVVTLAEAFGWSEAEILAMPPGRRRLYAEQASP